MAVNDRRKSANGEWVDETTLDVTLWVNRRGGKRVLDQGFSNTVEGRLKLDTWETKAKNAELRVVVTECRCLGRAAGGGGGNRPQRRSTTLRRADNPARAA